MTYIELLSFSPFCGAVGRLLCSDLFVIVSSTLIRDLSADVLRVSSYGLALGVGAVGGALFTTYYWYRQINRRDQAILLAAEYIKRTK
jgi:hypothetical protein